ncbi:MAG: hypothetical protein H7282_14680 [Cytophagaceae bacterium]|nr:hypothetical protein [Cytophagaceae bacterium]
MKKAFLFLLLLILFSFQSYHSSLLKNGVYYIDTVHLFSPPCYKIEGNHFKTYWNDHGGAYYGWGTYKIDLKNSMIHFKYKKFVALHHRPLSKYKVTFKKIETINNQLILFRHTFDSSETALADFDYYFSYYNNYIDSSFIK